SSFNADNSDIPSSMFSDLNNTSIPEVKRSLLIASILGLLSLIKAMLICVVFFSVSIPSFFYNYGGLKKNKAQATTLTDIEALVYPTTNKRAPTPFGMSVLSYCPVVLKITSFQCGT